jgi:hypothetical protein
LGDDDLAEAVAWARRTDGRQVAESKAGYKPARKRKS